MRRSLKCGWFRRGSEDESSPPDALLSRLERSERPVSCELFAAYAGEDLCRWREALGCRVWTCDPHRGAGHLANARWATRGAGVSPHIQVCICYERGLRSWIRGAAFCRIHSKIDVPAELRDVLSETARATNDAEMDEVLNGWSVRLQRAEDARRLARIRQMQDALQRLNREK